MRLGNLEFRTSSYIGNPPEHIGWEICKWEPNEYYGKESKFIKDGEYYHPNDEHYNFVSIHKSCFKHPETAYTIAHWSYQEKDESYEFEFIGDRPICCLTDKEWITFKKLISYGFKQLNPYWYEE